MSTPTVARERSSRTAGPKARAGTRQPQTATVPAQRPPARRSAAAPAAAQRAYARRADRAKQAIGAGRSVVGAGRAPFILLVMTLLAGGLVATLWLSTSAAADSYRLGEARQQTSELTERSEQLRRDVAAMQAAPALAKAARNLGMVPVSDVARLVVGPDGAVTVIGKPTAAVAVPAPTTPTTPAPAAAAGAPAAPAPAAAPAAGAPAAGAPAAQAAGAPAAPAPAAPAAAPARAAAPAAAPVAAAPAAAAPAGGG